MYDSESNKFTSSQARISWVEIFAALHKAKFPPEFLIDRAQGVAEVREDLRPTLDTPDGVLRERAKDGEVVGC